ncbi:hypothetical protein [Actinomadura parmotrematis]|uniref:DUF559 domain-containing protein n=1 Tax=Actinomadura parmotrematis TaxID=2864039 RepID=A0ABS7FZ85_9ACTN|nr:hypothetical protein [Actinomadura parmotrematis]MBW8485611.1 hypothetical protein [Actinomadura parmotrematis]
MTTPTSPATSPSPEAAASLVERAAALAGPGRSENVVIGRTAAWIWGLDVLPSGARPETCDVDLFVPGPAPPAGDLRPARVPAEHITERSGVRVTTLDRTALDCARWLPRLEAVAALDQFLRRGVRLDALKAMARTLPDYRDSKRLRAALRAADPRAESPGESWTRTLIIDAGLPRPTPQIPVMGPLGEPFYIDLGYEPYLVGIEYDGERHHAGRRARSRDEARRRWLKKEMEWDVIPVTKDLLTRPAPYLEALLTALLHRGWNPTGRDMDRIATNLTRLHRRRPNPTRRRPHH